MDLAPKDLQFLSIRDILLELTSIPKQSPKTFSLVTLTLIFPLSLAILAQSLFTKPLIHEPDCTFRVIEVVTDPVQLYHKWTLILFQLFYLIFLFAFSLLSTAAVVFTVASLYTSKPVSFSNTLSAIPKALKPLFITFLWVSLLMVGYNFLFLGFWILIIEAAIANRDILRFVFYVVLVVLFSVVHGYTTALWHLASVVSVLEPVYGFHAMKKSYELLNGNTCMAYVLVSGYLTTCGVIRGVFGMVLVHGGHCYGVFARTAVGGSLVVVLVIVNLVGLLLQSVFYFICKSYHHQRIDKNALHDHLGGYLGDYVPLKSSIQMENMDVLEGN
ncbi:hypothetical protein M0R45_034840 [Rubus argutus]|uniref:Uncharacterized protein n=1 Tax=Rubus argutus TaxID=59490 RepID=A0AAW1VSF6_RUBAR